MWSRRELVARLREQFPRAKDGEPQVAYAEIEAKPLGDEVWLALECRGPRSVIGASRRAC